MVSSFLKHELFETLGLDELLVGHAIRATLCDSGLQI